MPTMPTTELAEFTQHSHESSRRLEQQLADLFPANRPQLRPYTVEGSLLAASDLPTRYDLPAISPVTPLPLTVFEEPAALVQPPFTLPARPITAPIATEEQPSPLVAVAEAATPIKFTEYTHPNARSSPQEQVEDGIKQHNTVPEKIFISSFCKLILDLMGRGSTYYLEGYEIELLSGNWLADDQVRLEGDQGPLPQPKSEQLPAWIADLAERKEETACGGIGGDGGDKALLQAS